MCRSVGKNSMQSIGVKFIDPSHTHAQAFFDEKSTRPLHFIARNYGIIVNKQHLAHLRSSKLTVKLLNAKQYYKCCKCKISYASRTIFFSNIQYTSSFGSPEILISLWFIIIIITNIDNEYKCSKKTTNNNHNKIYR